MALYAGLSPQDALAKWTAIRQKPADQRTPEEQADVEGNMTGLAQENPQAWMAVKTGINDNGQSKDIFNPQSGQWEPQQDKGFFSHPESWMQLGFGGALGGVGAAAALGGGAAAGAGAAPAASTAGTAAGTTAGATGGGMGGIFGAIGKGAGIFNNVAGALSNVGQIAGNDAAAAAFGRGQQGQLQQGQDRNAIGLYDAQLRAAQQALNQHSQLASQAGRGDLLSNVQDVQLSNLPASVQGRMPTLTGGLRPSVLGPNARQAGQTLSRNALLQLLQGPTNLPTAPTLTPLPDASGYDAFTKGLGQAGSYAGAISPFLGLFNRPNPNAFPTVGPPLPPGADIFQD